MNRLTITLPDDLYAMARAHAVANRKSISKAIGDLLRQNGSAQPAAAGSNPKLQPVSGFPIIELQAGVTMEEVQRALDDEDVRHLEMLGLNPEETKQALDS